MSGEELQKFIDSLPAGERNINALLDYVEDSLYDKDCNHSLRYSMQFMMENHLDFPRLTSWLTNNGGYCDCKVMEQIAPSWRRVFDEDE